MDTFSVAGTFSGSVDFGNGPVPSGGNNALFAASYSSAGTFRWVRNIGGGASGNNECHSLAVDGTGNVFLTGYFTGTNDFGGGPLVSVGAGDIFIASTHLTVSRCTESCAAMVPMRHFSA